MIERFLTTALEPQPEEIPPESGGPSGDIPERWPMPSMLLASGEAFERGKNLLPHRVASGVPRVLDDG